MTSFARQLLFATCVFACACGDDAGPSDGHEHDHDAATEADADADDHTDEDVPCNEAYPSFTAGMSVKAGDLTVKLLSIDPEPPRQRMKNDWVVQVVDASGAAVDGITLANAKSYMPVHRHGGRTPPTSAPGSAAGTLQLSDIDFIMRGPWQVLFDVQRNGAQVGLATIQICVE